MTELPLLSIVLPARNAARTLSRALESCLAQSFSDFELLCINDQSTDGTADILREFAGSDQRVRILETAAPGGLVPALNLGCGQAQGEWIARMDADDVSLPGRFEEQVAYLHRNDSVAVCGCAVNIVRESEESQNGEEPGAEEPASPLGGFRRYEAWINGLVTPEQIARERFVESPIVHPTAMIQRDCLEEIGGYRDGDGPEDYELWLRMMHAGMKIGKVPAVLYEWTDRPTRLTRTDPRYAFEKFLRTKAHYLAKLDTIRERGVMISGGGDAAKKIGRMLVQEGTDLHAYFDVHPRRIGKQIAGVPVLPVAEIPRASPDTPIQLGAVGKDGRRDQIRSTLAPLGYTEGLDFFCVC